VYKNVTTSKNYLP